MTIKDDALTYAANGFAVLPTHTVRDGLCSCGCSDSGCRTRGKHPRTDIVFHAVKDATLDPARISAWPNDVESIGVALGQASGNLMVFDVDDPDVAQALLHPSIGLKDETGVSVTGRGTHIWFRTTGSTKTFFLKHPDGRKIGEVRGDDAYVIVPPSMHYSGRQYKWVGLPPGQIIPKVETTTNTAEYVETLLDDIGVPSLSSIDTDLEDAIPELAVMPMPVPDYLVNTGQLSEVVALTKGTITSTELDRSGRMFFNLLCVYEQSLAVDQELDLATLAGIAKMLDIRAYHKYESRRDADKYYLSAALRVLREKDNFMKKITRAKTRAGLTLVPGGQGNGATAGNSQPSYSWDPDQGFVFHRRGREWPKVCNFKPKILADVEIDKGGESTRAWQVHFELADGRYHEFFLPAEERSVYKLSEVFARELPADYNVYPGMWDHVRGAMQEMSAGQWVESREFATTGWVEYGANRVYLLPGAPGAIGSNGIDQSIRINIDHLPEDEPITSPALSNYGKGVRPPTTPEEYRAAWDAFEALINSGPIDVTVGIVLQILAGPLIPAGAGEMPPLVHVLGRTGSLKTSFSLAALSLFGTFDESTAPPSNWGSTTNSLQTILHTTKDLTLLVDDFKNSVVRSRQGLVQLIQQYADGSVRTRQGTNQKLQKVQAPRGLILSNGEDVWEREASADARTITIQIRPGDINEDKLTDAQEAVIAGSMQMFGGAYLQWLARNPQIFENKEVTSLKQEWRKRLREQAESRVHLRVISTVASLGAVGNILLRFVQDTYPSNTDKVRSWIRDATRALSTGVRERGAQVEEASPFRQIARAITENIAGRTACLWPAEGLDYGSNRLRIPDVPNAEIVGYYFDANDSLGEDRLVLLTQNATYEWYQRAARTRGEDVGFSWMSVKKEAIDSHKGRVIDRMRVKTDETTVSRPQISGVAIPLSELIDVTHIELTNVASTTPANDFA